MEKSKQILGLKQGGEFSLAERNQIVQEYLSSGHKKREIWKKYTGQAEEHGQILRWMRQLGYAAMPEKRNLVSMKKIQPSNEASIENIQLKRKIRELEKALETANLKSYALSTMIDIAEKELKISIRKKSNTKQSK
jgi:transposase-like protein